MAVEAAAATAASVSAFKQDTYLTFLAPHVDQVSFVPPD